MSCNFFHKPKSKHELKLEMLSNRFRQKPRVTPDPYSSQSFILTHIGKSAVSKLNASGLGGVHRVLFEYYLFFLKLMIRDELSLEDFERLNPANKRSLLVKKDTLIMKFRRHRRPPSDGMLINEEQIYRGNQVVYCDCFCFEVVLPSEPKCSEPEICYAYFRHASDCRRAVPESNLFPLDRELSSFFLNNRKYSRPSIVVCVLGPSRVCNNLYCHVFVTENPEIGLRFVRTVVDYTYGQMDYEDTFDQNGFCENTYQTTVKRKNGPLRVLQSKSQKSGQQRSKSPRQVNFAPLSGKNGRSMLFTPGVNGPTYISQMNEDLEKNNFNSVETQSSSESSENAGPKDYYPKYQRNLLSSPSWLTSSTPALLLAPMTEEEMEPLRRRIVQFQLAHEATDKLKLRHIRPSRLIDRPLPDIYHDGPYRGKYRAKSYDRVGVDSQDRTFTRMGESGICRCSGCQLNRLEPRDIVKKGFLHRSQSTVRN